MKIVVSNGFNKFPMSDAAAELARRGHDVTLVTGAYPTPLQMAITRCLFGRARAERLAGRATGEPSVAVFSNVASELIHAAALLLLRSPSGSLQARIGQFLDGLSFQLYRLFQFVKVRGRLCRDGIFLYRSGFGGRLCIAAHRQGCTTLAYHSIPHPYVFDYLIANVGRLPDKVDARSMSPLSRRLAADLELADHYVCEGNFVAQTFRFVGIEANRVHAVHQGVDEYFQKLLSEVAVDRPKPSAQSLPLRFLFVGADTPRKGLRDVLEATRRFPATSLTLTIAGMLQDTTRTAFADVLQQPNVHVEGMVPRRRIAELMSMSDVFVFCSRAEGSVRVIFEAMAAGCYVVTTPNSGSIVETGVHGCLVQPGDIGALEDAIRGAMESPSKVREIGGRNRALILERYDQRTFGDQLDALVRELTKSGYKDLAFGTTQVTGHPASCRELQ